MPVDNAKSNRKARFTLLALFGWIALLSGVFGACRLAYELARSGHATAGAGFVCGVLGFLALFVMEKKFLRF